MKLPITILFLAFFCNGKINAQEKFVSPFIDKDNVATVPITRILPLNNFNFHVSPYDAYGTKTYVDTIKYNGAKYLFFAYGISKDHSKPDYKSFFNLVVKLNDSESIIELAKTITNCSLR